MRILLTILCIAAVLLLSLIAAGNYFYNFTILRRKKDFLSKDPELQETVSGASWNSNKEWLQLQHKEELLIEACDRLKLYAAYIPCPIASRKTVLLVHGYSSWHGSMGAFAQYYLEELGYNVLLPDLRGHGNSQGSYIGFGWHDRKDIMKWIELLTQKGADEILLHGVSMGGSTVLMTSSETLTPNVKCIISDCAYSSTVGILSYQMKRMFRLPKFPIIQATSLICKLRAGYYFGEASALNQVKRSKIPTLFIHGTADRFVPFQMVKELYQAAACPKQLLEIEDAAHGTSFWKDPEAYKAAIEKLICKYMN